MTPPLPVPAKSEVATVASTPALQTEVDTDQFPGSGPDALLRLQAILGNRTVLRMRDQRAPQIVQRQRCACGAEVGPGGECAECEAKRQAIQRRAVDSDEQPEQVPDLVGQVLQTSGEPLDEGTRSEMETFFGHDFGRVRLHTGQQAEVSARSISALAYTAGPHIVFGARAPAPRSLYARHLLAHELAHVVQQSAAAGGTIPTAGNGIAPAGGVHEQQAESAARAAVAGHSASSLSPVYGSIQRAPDDAAANVPAPEQRVAFVWEEGLNLRTRPGQSSLSIIKLKFGQRMHMLDDPNPTPGWQKVAVLGMVGYVSMPLIRIPPTDYIKKDPGLSLIKVRPGQTFWGLVKEVYHIHGNESTPDKNINHFINAIRAFNTKPGTFKIKTDTLDDIGNALISGRDASDTELIAGMALWIPSFGVAARIEVGSGTVTGEISRIISKIEQKIADFKAAGKLSVSFIPAAIAKQAGQVGAALLKGLIDFAVEAATILAASTAAGALIGALFGGVGAAPGAEIGFEIGLFILEVYGLYEMIESVLGLAGTLVSQLGTFISIVWSANGDKAQIEKAAMVLADALGLLVSVILNALAAYVLKRGASALMKTKFAKTVGEKPLMQWVQQRQQMTTTKDILSKSPKASTAQATQAPATQPAKSSAAPDDIDAALEKTFSGGKDEGAFQTTSKLARGNLGEKLATESLASKGHTILDYKPGIEGTNQGGIDIVTMKNGIVYAVDNKALSRGGNVSSVSALTTNYSKNIATVRKDLSTALSRPNISASETAVLKQAIAAIDSGNVVRVVTNANVVGPANNILSGVTQKLQTQGITFIDVFK